MVSLLPRCMRCRDGWSKEWPLSIIRQRSDDGVLGLGDSTETSGGVDWVTEVGVFSKD